jgi:hypothetical protein
VGCPMLDEDMRAAFPRLGYDCAATSSPARGYNCIAWAAGDNTRWWEPPQPWAPWFYWPSEASVGYAIDDLRSAYHTVGFEECPDGALEDESEKVALYGSQAGVWLHAARQLPNGRWTSKLGREDDIEHGTPYELECRDYGTVIGFMKRTR